MQIKNNVVAWATLDRDRCKRIPESKGARIMGQRQVSFDTNVFIRTASIFEAKRHVFRPAALENLAKEVVRYLVDAKLRAASFDTPAISPDGINAFCDALIQPSADQALRFIEDRRAEGVTRQGVYLGYITGATLCLGDGVAFLALSCSDGSARTAASRRVW